ncbi:MAG: DUF1302 family protein [Gammaproteobacteria bacterium]
MAGILALAAGEAQAGAVSDMFSEVDRAMAVFDPIGTHVRAPIERAVPNLRFKGFIRQWTDILLEQQGQTGFQNQDYRFLQLQNLLELETAYHIQEGLDLNAVTHVMYDGAYDWQRSKGLYADRYFDQAELYDTSERLLREFYVSYRRPRFDLLLGKQQIAWGKMDGQFIDVINGMDRREAVQLETEDFEWRRMPTWMANATFHFGQNSLQMLYIFDFEEDRFARPGMPWYSPALPQTRSDIILPARRPESDNFDDHEYGLRFDRMQGSLSYGFIYYYGWAKSATEHVLGTAQRGGQTFLELEPRHARLHHAGVTADYAFALTEVPWVGTLPMVVRVEGLYTNGVRFVDFGKQALARLGAPTDGTTLRDTVRAAVAAEFALPGRSTFIFQASYYRTLDWTTNLGPGFGGGFGDEWTLIPVAFLSRPFGFTRDRLSMEATVFPIISGPDRGFQGVKTKLRMVYKVSQFVKAQLIYNGYDGGSPTDTYGQYNHWDNVGWELSYEF